MNTSHPPAASDAGLMRNTFTEPTSKAFNRWVAVINFWILILYEKKKG